MSKTKTGKGKPRGAKTIAADTAAIATPEPPRERVPPEAEDFAHTLRRLAAERLEKQARNPGLYR